IFAALGQKDLVGVGESAAPAFAGEFAFAAALLLFVLPFFFGADGERLIDFGGSRRAGAARKLAQFSLEFLDTLACGLELPLLDVELPLLRDEEFDEAVRVDAPLPQVLFELLDGVHADSICKRPRPSCANFPKISRIEWTATSPRYIVSSLVTSSLMFIVYD
ncbi:MAG: hypothetical protein K2X38_15240, partial [Gemmataceae bacterium]|nr:hypothetical protein [Gemmataceae bacterium]